MKLDPETLDHLIDEGVITFEQAEDLRRRDQQLLNPQLIPSIRNRENHERIAKMQQLVPDDPEADTCVGDALASLQRNDDEVVVILLDIMRRLLSAQDESPEILSSNERQQTLSRITTALLPIIVADGPKETVELAALNMNKLQRGFSPTGVVTQEMHDDVIRWVAGLTKPVEYPEQIIDDNGIQMIAPTVPVSKPVDMADLFEAGDSNPL